MKCCICGREIEGYGNNPHPVYADDFDARCCDECNDNVVIPLRILGLHRDDDEIARKIMDEMIDLIEHFGVVFGFVKDGGKDESNN